MKIKCGRKEYIVGSSDLILDNGACYQLITKEERSGYGTVSPIVSKTTFKKYLKEGLIRLSKKKYKTRYKSLDLYEFVEQET